MNREQFKLVLNDQMEEIKEMLNDSELISRDISKELIYKYLSKPNIVAILGVRRSGKSTFALQIFSKHDFCYINFDDERFYDLKAEDLNDLYLVSQELFGDKEYYIFDEIQNIRGWELFLNRLRRTKKIIITGSNANLLSGDLATHLTGRYLDIHLFPFSFKEILKFSKIDINNKDDYDKYFYSTKGMARVRSLFNEYENNGGFPECRDFGIVIVRKLFSDIIYKDIITRYNLKNVEELKALSLYIISNHSNLFSYTSLKKAAKISDNQTVSNYISYLENSYLIFTLSKFSYKLKSSLHSPKKYYVIDSGLISALSLKSMSERGRLMENLVAIELWRRCTALDNDCKIYYWNDYASHEVDFVVLKGKIIVQLIQVSYINDYSEIIERELNGFRYALKELKCNDLLLITNEYEDEVKLDDKSVRCIPLWKWICSINE